MQCVQLYNILSVGWWWKAKLAINCKTAYLDSFLRHLSTALMFFTGFEKMKVRTICQAAEIWEKKGKMGGAPWFLCKYVKKEW